MYTGLCAYEGSLAPCNEFCCEVQCHAPFVPDEKQLSNES